LYRADCAGFGSCKIISVIYIYNQSKNNQITKKLAENENNKMKKLGNEIAKYARSGALEAASKYYKISAKGTIWNRGIESWISAHIANSIHKKTGYPIELELNAKSVFDQSGLTDNFTQCETLTDKSRFDVSIFRTNSNSVGDFPYGIVEVKKRFAPFKWDKDCQKILELQKITEAIGAKGVRFGLLVAVEPIRLNQRKEIDQKIEEAEIKFKNIANCKTRIERSIKMQDFGLSKKKNIPIIGAAAVSVLLERN